MSMPSWTSPRASARTLPISRVIARASRSLLSRMSSPNAYRISPRFGAGRRLPARQRHLGGLDGHRDVRRRARLEAPDDVAPIGRVQALERPPGHGVDPLAGDEQLERLVVPPGSRTALPSRGSRSCGRRIGRLWPGCHRSAAISRYGAMHRCSEPPASRASASPSRRAPSRARCATSPAAVPGVRLVRVVPVLPVHRRGERLAESGSGRISTARPRTMTTSLTSSRWMNTFWLRPRDSGS